MAKIYVDGTIVIKTSDFKYEGGGALFGIPEGAETIETNEEINGIPCLVIDDKRPLSMFNEYYATGGFSTLYCWSYYLNSNCHRAYENYQDNKKEIEKLLENVFTLNSHQQEFIYKLLLQNVVTIFDAFVCETVVSKITSSKECFDSFYEKFYKDLTNNNKTHFDKLNRGELEYEIVQNQLRKSYANIERVNDTYKKIWGFDFDICEGHDIQEWFDWRHRIVHRNGREKDGTHHQFCLADVKKALVDIDSAVQHIMTIIENG